MRKDDHWNTYLTAMRVVLATHERFVERLRVFIGDPPVEPTTLKDEHWREWLELARELEARVTAHSRILEEFYAATQTRR